MRKSIYILLYSIEISLEFNLTNEIYIAIILGAIFCKNITTRRNVTKQNVRSFDKECLRAYNYVTPQRGKI